MTPNSEISQTETAPYIEVPPSLENDKLTLAHEGGHATVALALGRKIKAYNIAGKVAWVSKQFPDKSNIALAKLTHREGVVSYDTKNLTQEEIRLSAAAGAAGELLWLGYIESTAAEQEHDRKKGGFSSIWGIQETADKLANDMDTGSLAVLHRFVMHRLINGKGFDDINEAIDQGIKPIEYVRNSS
jgi:hypothetical protein